MIHRGEVVDYLSEFIKPDSVFRAEHECAA
jgi:hypothetical protein